MKPDDVQAVRAGRLLADLRGHPRWKFTGPDRVRYLNGQVTNDVKHLQPGRSLHAAVTDNKGRVQGEVWIASLDDALWVDAPAEYAGVLGPRLGKYLVADDAAMEDATSTYELYFAAGETAPESALGRTAASRRFGLDGWDLWLPAGAPPPRPVASAEIWEHLRILHDSPRPGREYDEATLAPEVFAEGPTLRYDKGCYIGQEVIARVKSVGHVRRKLCRLEGDAPPGGLPLELFCAGRPAGRLTSATALDDGARGLGVIARDFCAEQQGLEAADGRKWMVKAVLV